MATPKVEVLRAACCVAGVDGEICDREHPMLERLAEEAGVGRASLNAMVERARTDRYFFEEQFDALTADADETIKTLFHVALVDGDLESQERIVIQHFADKLGMSSDRFEQLLQSAERHVRKE